MERGHGIEHMHSLIQSRIGCGDNLFKGSVRVSKRCGDSVLPEPGDGSKRPFSFRSDGYLPD
ncbi:hypothetical protein D3C81_2165110 [compost metagenome]